jgi:7-cyano-7-deazaguanine reductase
MDEAGPRDDFVALGHPGTAQYAGLETFENPGIAHVEMTSDELVTLGPMNQQPDMYTVTIEYTPAQLCLESKSLKLYLMQFRNEQIFCEELAVRIRDDIARALAIDAAAVRVVLTQKARGGITITARA